MRTLRNEIEYRLKHMGFDTSDVTLQVPLQAIWTAIEGLEHLFNEADTLEFDNPGEV